MESTPRCRPRPRCARTCRGTAGSGNEHVGASTSGLPMGSSDDTRWRCRRASQPVGRQPRHLAILQQTGWAISFAGEQPPWPPKPASTMLTERLIVRLLPPAQVRVRDGAGGVASRSRLGRVPRGLGHHVLYTPKDSTAACSRYQANASCGVMPQFIGHVPAISTSE